MGDSLGVYISVPFCRAKCTYCNFASGVFGVERMQAYVERVCEEMRGVRAEAERLGAALPGVVDTVFFGGGTPSLLSAPQMREIFATLRGEFAVAAGAEITLECAPGQLGDEVLEELLGQGMNRISFGVQSFVDAEARAVGRLHTRTMCLAEIARMRAAGVAEINVDLICGLPQQTAASWRASVEDALASGVPHVSVYMLEVDDESRLGREVLAAGAKYGAALVPTEDETADWYGEACGWLEAAGVAQYEISNFARAGHAARHNVKYWRREPYVGFGLDAHTMLRAGVGAVRRANTADLDGYLLGTATATATATETATAREERGGRGGFAADAVGALKVLGAKVEAEAEAEVERVGVEAGFEEALFLGLRMNEGVWLEGLRAEFGEGLTRGALEAVVEVEEAGLVTQEGGRLMLTARGRMASNEVFARLLVERSSQVSVVSCQ